MRVEYVRDGLVEEFHDGIIATLNDSIGEPYYIRSCAKPLQATLLVDYNVDFTEDELAFCCGSHAGEDCHIKIGLQILSKLGLDKNLLKCGIHEPLSETAKRKLILSKSSSEAIHNNCSGKHIGFLAMCLANGWDLDTYYEPTHPLQIAIKKKLYELCEIKKEYPITTDGCGVPILGMPLKNLLIGYKNLVNLYPKITNSILNNPYIFGGENRQDTEIIQNTEGILAKVGAGGLCVVYNTNINDGFVIKMLDASTSARRFAVIDYINKLKWGTIHIDTTIKTLSGKIVGNITVKY
jgi:L-asparaginase II